MWITATASIDAAWVAAWGQVGGAAATTGAVIVAFWLGWRDRRWRRADQAERDMGQARLVTVDVDHPYRGLDNDGEPEFPMVVAMTNNSAEPVVDAKVTEVRSETQPRLGWDHRWSGDPTIRYDAPVLGPGETWSGEVYYTLPEAERINGQDEAPGPFGENAVTISFTDARGLRWTRTGTELPVRQDPVAKPRWPTASPWTRS